MSKYKIISIGIDQSYKNVGISISGDSKLLLVTNFNLEQFKTKTEKRKALKKHLNSLCKSIIKKSDFQICIIERIRLRSQGFLNIDYIKSIGALNSLIVDVFSKYNIKVYSVDTRCWKAQIVGTSKGKTNKYGVPEEKYPTVEWVINQGFENSILKVVKGKKNKGTFIKNNIKYEYDNDASDSAAISQFYFKGDKNKLKIET